MLRFVSQHSVDLAAVTRLPQSLCGWTQVYGLLRKRTFCGWVLSRAVVAQVLALLSPHHVSVPASSPATATRGEGMEAFPQAFNASAWSDFCSRVIPQSKSCYLISHWGSVLFPGGLKAKSGTSISNVFPRRQKLRIQKWIKAQCQYLKST